MWVLLKNRFRQFFDVEFISEVRLMNGSVNIDEKVELKGNERNIPPSLKERRPRLLILLLFVFFEFLD